MSSTGAVVRVSLTPLKPLQVFLVAKHSQTLPNYHSPAQTQGSNWSAQEKVVHSEVGPVPDRRGLYGTNLYFRGNNSKISNFKKRYIVSVHLLFTYGRSACMPANNSHMRSEQYRSLFAGEHNFKLTLSWSHVVQCCMYACQIQSLIS